MARPRLSDQETGFLKSFWDEVRIMEADYSGAVTLFVTPTKRPGVIEVRMVFTSLLGDEQNGLHTHSYKCEFPNANDTTLAGDLWRGARVLHNMVQNDWVTQAPRAKTRG